MAAEKKKDEAKQKIDNKNYEAAKSDSKEIVRNATAYNPGFQKFTQVTGVKDKAKVVTESADTKIKGSTDKNAYGREKSSAKFMQRQEVKRADRQDEKTK